MNKTIAVLCLSMIIMLPCLYAQSREVLQLQEVLKATDASWTAADNPISRLSPEQRQKRLGLLPGMRNPESRKPATVITLPVRESRYECPLTPVKDQGDCGSCYSFGACATYEGWKLLRNGVTCDLSEQYFLMKAKDVDWWGGGGCNGWYLKESMELLREYGVADEQACPYLGTETACQSSAQPIYKIGDWECTTDINTIKTMLQTYGPLLVGFAVYSDFYNYDSGYYEYKQGSQEGYHAVAIVGYDEVGWKVKNSWGKYWGESGYFRIKYSQMDNSVEFATCFGGAYYITK